MFEIGGLSEELMKEALTRAGHKLGLTTKIVSRQGVTHE